MPWYVVALIVVGMTTMDAIIVWALLRVFRTSYWEPLAAKFPPVPPGPGAVRREFESFSMGMFNLGWSVHVEVDEAHLHLYPAWLLRIAGATPISVPWGEVRLSPGRRGRGLVKARLGTQAIAGPAWCLDLADPDGATRGRPSR